MKTKLFIMAVAAATFAISGCQKKGCTDSTALNYDENAKEDDGSCTYANAMLHFHSKLGSDDFAYNTEVTNWEGRKLKFTKAQMYLSGFKFHGDDGMAMVDDSYVLAKPGTMMYEVGNVASGHYHGFGFSVGVDSTANRLTDPASWPSDHALSVNNPDHAFWSWNSGFIFIVLEGDVDTSATMSGTEYAPFVYHVGLDDLKRDLMFMKHQDVDEDVTLHVECDFLKLLDGVDMRDRQLSHSMGPGMPLAEAIADNAADAVTAE